MFEVLPCGDRDEFGRAIGAIGQYFSPPPSEETLERFSQLLPLDRMHAALDGGRIVGGAGAFPFDLSVPGGSPACGGGTVVGAVVSSIHRASLKIATASRAGCASFLAVSSACREPRKLRLCSSRPPPPPGCRVISLPAATLPPSLMH